MLLELVAARPRRGPLASLIPGPSLDFVFVVHPASRLQRYMTMFLPSFQELTLFPIHPADHGIGQGQGSCATCCWGSTRQGLGDFVASKQQVRFPRFLLSEDLSEEGW